MQIHQLSAADAIASLKSKGKGMLWLSSVEAHAQALKSAHIRPRDGYRVEEVAKAAADMVLLATSRVWPQSRWKKGARLSNTASS